MYKWKCFTEKASLRPCRWDGSCGNFYQRTTVSAGKRLKRSVMKRKTSAKMQSWYHFHVSSTLLYLRNEIINTVSVNLNIKSKNMWDTNSKPDEMNQTVMRKFVTKSNEKSSAEINCGKRYEILYIKDSGHMQYEKY